MIHSISILQSRQIGVGVDPSMNLPKNRRSNKSFLCTNMCYRPHICALRFISFWIFIWLIQFPVAGFKGKDCSVDVDLCSFGLCGEHTLKCAETEGGRNVSCTCERGEEPFGSAMFAVLPRYQVQTEM